MDEAARDDAWMKVEPVREQSDEPSSAVHSRVLVTGLFLSASFLGGCSADSDDAAGSSACSVFLMESPADGVTPTASTRPVDIERAIGRVGETLDAETAPATTDWDLVVTGPIGVTPDGECGSIAGLGDLRCST